ncbi:T9SS type A sorting domain-containing protein, partial [Arsenicibacter rosenii]|uniref:T9SS type A sorting domain-containing protein n=1 Tax=Arsenicibacter rosenii TaxID=1750698 RepID=UPI0015A69FEB
ADPNNSTILLEARQNGQVVTRLFNFRTYNCNGTTPPTQPGSLSLLAPGYACATRQITFQTAGGNGSPVEFRAVGVRDWGTNPVATIEAPVVADPNNSTILLEARQSGQVVTRSFNFRQACGAAREAASFTNDLLIKVFGNPTQQELIQVEVSGLEEQAFTVNVMDLNGRLLEEQNHAANGDKQLLSVRTGKQAGLYWLRIQTASKSKTVKIIRQ